MKINSKTVLLFSLLFCTSTLFSQENSKLEWSLLTGVEHSFIKLTPDALDPNLSGWRSATHVNGNFNLINSIRLNYNTEKLQIRTGIAYSSPGFDAINSTIKHTVSIGQLSQGILPYSETVDFRIRFRLFHFNLGLGVPYQVSDNTTIVFSAVANVKFFSDYRFKTKRNLETWNELSFSQTYPLGHYIKTTPIIGVVASVEATHQIFDKKPNGIKLNYRLTYGYDINSITFAGNYFFLRSLGFNAGIIIPFHKKSS